MFESNSDYFEAVDNLAADLKKTGNIGDAEKLIDGLSAINGLTDGWADFLDYLLEVEANSGGELTNAQALTVKALCDVAHEAVYRKNRK